MKSQPKQKYNKDNMPIDRMSSPNIAKPHVSGSLPTKAEIISEAKSIYKEMNNSTEAEAIRQAKTAELMFIAGAWFSRGFKGNDR